jgi:hypothetical protein
MLFSTDFPLDILPGPRDATPLEYCQCVQVVPQVARNHCWAACIDALNRRNGEGPRRAEIAANHLVDCTLSDCHQPEPGGCCDKGMKDGDEIMAVWHDNGYKGAHYTNGKIEPEVLRDQLERVGPVQIELGHLHLVLLDRWRRGTDGEVTVWLMDPESETYHRISERALRANTDRAELAAWTGTVTGLRSTKPSANCRPAACKNRPH